MVGTSVSLGRRGAKRNGDHRLHMVGQGRARQSVFPIAVTTRAIKRCARTRHHWAASRGPPWSDFCFRCERSLSRMTKQLKGESRCTACLIPTQGSRASPRPTPVAQRARAAGLSHTQEMFDSPLCRQMWPSRSCPSAALTFGSVIS